MCRCNPLIRTPFCGKSGCEWPEGTEENDAERLLRHLTTLRQAARRVVACWGDPSDPLIDPDMGAAVDALKEAIQTTKPPFPGGKP